MSERVRRITYRCEKCGRRLFDGRLYPGTEIEIRCWHKACAHMNVIPRPEPEVKQIVVTGLGEDHVSVIEQGIQLLTPVQ